jgi:ABC-type lipoprotein release transport system permease subunit
MLDRIALAGTRRTVPHGNDAVSMALAVEALALVAVCASLIPAVKATAVQPVEILRKE